MELLVIVIWLLFGACIFEFGACGVQVKPEGQLDKVTCASPLDLRYASVAGPGASSCASWAVDTEPPELDIDTVGVDGVGVEGIDEVDGGVEVASGFTDVQMSP